MKAITLHQPWASLVAIGAKRIETRSWSTDYRGPLAIHAGQHIEPGQRLNDTILMTLGKASMDQGRLLDLPMGAVVATCNLVAVVPIGSYTDDHQTCEVRRPEEADRDWVIIRYRPSTDPKRRRHHDYLDESALGDFTSGRFAWLLSDVVKLDEPIPAKGMQRLWEWEDR